MWTKRQSMWLKGRDAAWSSTLHHSIFRKERLLQMGSKSSILSVSPNYQEPGASLSNHTIFPAAKTDASEPINEWRRIARRVNAVSVRKKRTRKSFVRQQKGPISVSLLLILIGISIVGISYAKSLDDRSSHSILLVGSMFTFLGLCILLLVLLFALICQRFGDEDVSLHNGQ